MTTLEFSSEFDILYNNIMSNQAPGLDEYEKSTFLTLAQESLVQDVYRGIFNGEPFEDSELSIEFISKLLKQKYLDSIDSPNHIIPNSYIYQLPEDLWLTIYESANISGDSECIKNKLVVVVPTTHDEFFRTNRNPFRKSNSNRVLKLNIGDNRIELISDYTIEKYSMSYISKPAPIILTNLEEYNSSINGVTEVTECILNPICHRIILTKAVQLAKVAMTNN